MMKQTHYAIKEIVINKIATYGGQYCREIVLTSESGEIVEIQLWSTHEENIKHRDEINLHIMRQKNHDAEWDNMVA